MSKICVYRGEALVGDYPLPDQDTITIGRAATNDIVLADSTRKVSRYHAVLVRNPSTARYFVRDLASRYSIRIKGQYTHRALIEDGENLYIGDYRLVWSAQNTKSTAPVLLRVVPKTEKVTTSLYGSTAGITGFGSTLSLGNASARRELLHQVRQSARSRTDAPRFAATIMPAICRVTQSDRGFVRVFSSEQDRPDLDFGLVGFQAGLPIEISDPDFLPKLKAGQVVCEGHVILAPILKNDVAIGFLSLQRVSNCPFELDDAMFLMRLCKALGGPLSGSAASPMSLIGSVGCEWPRGLIGNSKLVRELRNQIQLAAHTSLNVMILGSTGTGKELVAEAIHAAARPGAPFVAQNVGRTTETLAEAAIFGYGPKSGIDGADPQGVPGWFERADRGTLFLDEIHRLSAAMQDKFLRVLQDKQITRIGAAAPRTVDVKVLAATDCDLTLALQAGTLREAFYYRFGQFVRVPALRERPEDIPILSYYFLDTLGEGTQVPKSISHRAMDCLLRYPWPGNVRELEHCVINASAGRSLLFSWDLPDHIRNYGSAEGAPAVKPQTTGRSLAEGERHRIMETLEAVRGNITQAAKVLRISRMTILKKMDKYGIPRSYGDPKAE